MWSVVLGAFSIAFAPIFVKAVTLPASVIGFYRCGIAFLILTPIVVIGRRRSVERLSPGHRRYLGFILGAGLFFAGDLYVWHQSIHFVGAGMATLLANTSTIHLALFGVVFIKERPSSRFFICLGLAFVGVTLLVGLPDARSLHENYWLGIGLGLSTGLFYSGFILCVRAAERSSNSLSPVERLASISFVTAIILLSATWFSGESFVLTGMEFFWLGLLALVAQVIGWLLIAKGLRTVPVTSAGIGLLVQPVAALGLGAMIYGESLSVFQMMGAVLTLVGIYYGSTRFASKA